MSETVERQIQAAEERLRLAMLASDVQTLDALIAPGLVFTTHLGTLLSKQDDLHVYRTAALKFQAIEPSEQQVLVFDGLAYVCVRVRLVGAFNGVPFRDDIRFSRVWQRSLNDGWQVIAGQATVIAPQ